MDLDSQSAKVNLNSTKTSAYLKCPSHVSYELEPDPEISGIGVRFSSGSRISHIDNLKDLDRLCRHSMGNVSSFDSLLHG